MNPSLMDTSLYIAIGICAAVVVHFVFYFLKKRAAKSKTLVDDVLVHSLGTPLTLLAFFIPFFYSVQHWIDLYPQYESVLNENLLHSGFIFVGTWIAATFLDDFLRTYGTAWAEKTDTDLDDKIVALLQKIGKYIIWFTGIIWILTLYDINVTPLIAGAGIFGIAIALAAQDLISNFFGGAVILTDQPFKAGDRVLINDILGDVIHIGPRSTRIITLDSDIVTMPNTKIATSVIHNYSLPNPQVRIQIPVTVSNSEDIPRIKNVLGDICDEAVKNRHDIIAHDRVPTVHLMGVNKSSMTFQITVFSAGFSFNNDIQDYMNVQIIERFRKEGIPFS